MEGTGFGKNAVLPDSNPIIPAERQEQIKAMISANGSVSIAELTKRFQVSKATLRRDLDEICRDGAFTRTFGGAKTLTGNTLYDKPHEDKMKLNSQEKLRIGKMAATFVNDGDTIIIDSGTTAYAFAQFLEDKKQITVITNDLFIALDTALDHTSSMIVLPGQRQDLTKVIIGKQAEDMLAGVRVAKLFMTADAICLDSGISNVSLLESGMKTAMIDAAEEIILMADSSKFEKRSLINVLPDFSRIDRIITDDGLAAGLQRQYEQLAELIIV